MYRGHLYDVTQLTKSYKLYDHTHSLRHKEINLDLHKSQIKEDGEAAFHQSGN
jgi:hypothetical protein